MFFVVFVFCFKPMSVTVFCSSCYIIHKWVKFCMFFPAVPSTCFQFIYSYQCYQRLDITSHGIVLNDLLMIERLICLFSRNCSCKNILMFEFMNELRHFTFYSCISHSKDDKNRIVGRPSLNLQMVASKVTIFCQFVTPLKFLFDWIKMLSETVELSFCI